MYDYTDENGKRRYKSFTSNNPSPAGKREAELLAAQYATTKELQNNEIETDITFKKALSEYIKSKEPVLSPSTIRGYKSIENVLKDKYSSFLGIKIRDMEELIQYNL